MDARLWEEVEKIFTGALERPAADRPRYVEEACGGDAALARLVGDLLAAHGADPDFLAEPLARVTELIPEADAAEAGPDPMVPGYRIVRRLARGGMGEVFLAVQEGEGFERPVALKLVQPGLAAGEMLRRFEQERRILAALNHPSIARLLDGGVARDGRPYLAMEYVEGVTLDRYCDDRRLDVDARLALFRAVCDAVQHAHQSLVLHLDLKPANVLVTDGGVPKLVDFGIAALLTPERTPHGEGVRTRTWALTPEYAAPEQLRGGTLSAATDVYGLGVLLYHLLVGRRPFRKEDDNGWEKLERAVLTEDPPRPSTLAASWEGAERAAAARATTPRRLARRLAGDLDAILLRALRKEPERRYASAAALAGDLHRHRVHRPVQARRRTPAYRLSRFARRNAVSITAAATVAASLTGAAVVSLRESRRAAAERDRALEVRGFLLEMFGATGADRAVGDTVTARQLLDRQAETLETAYRSDPELQAEMTAVLAEGYDRLGLLDRAGQLAGEALDRRREVLPPDHADVGRSLALLGWIRHEQGKGEQADSLLRAAVAVLERQPRAGTSLARALNDLGVVREAAGDVGEAEELYVRALGLRRATQGSEHRAVAVTASNLSVIRYRRGDYEGAVAAATDALEAMRAAVGPDHQRSVIIQSNLAAMRVALGDLAGAEREYRELLEREERLRGPEHPVTLRVRGSLGSVLVGGEKFEEAEEVLRSLVERQSATLGDDHPRVALSRVRLAQALNGLGRHDESRALVEPSLERLVAAVGPDHAVVVEARETLADALEAADPAAAEALHRQALAASVRTNGPHHPTTAQVRLRLADRLKLRGRWREALDLYTEAHRDFAAVLPPGHRHLHRTRVRMAEMAYRLGATEVADSLLGEAYRAFEVGGADAHIMALADSLRARLHPPS